MLNTVVMACEYHGQSEVTLRSSSSLIHLTSTGREDYTTMLMVINWYFTAFFALEASLPYLPYPLHMIATPRLAAFSRRTR